VTGGLRFLVRQLFFLDDSAALRSLELLRENLTSAQRDELDTFGHFHVVGGATGRRYRIHRGYSMNVEQLGPNDSRAGVLCFFPQGSLPIGDVMLAQKLALETFESETLSIANRNLLRM
jgi:hypothetical protein